MNQKPKPIIYTGWAYSYTSTEFYKDELLSGKTNFIKPGKPLFTNSIDLCNYLCQTKQNWVITAVLLPMEVISVIDKIKGQSMVITPQATIDLSMYQKIFTAAVGLEVYEIDFKYDSQSNNHFDQLITNQLP